MKLALILGITGQDGSYLTELLLEKEYKVYGIIRRTSLFYKSRVHHLEKEINLIFGDINDGLCLHNYIHDIINSNEGFECLEIYNLMTKSRRFIIQDA